MKWIGQPMCIVCRIRILTCPSEADCARRLFDPIHTGAPWRTGFGVFSYWKGVGFG
ncbi:MAG: hypothetical protein HFI13_07865 [Lachnospiraceae bacterium]|nr:hypothetical protein [Lachnospiraceae bacterium]